MSFALEPALALAERGWPVFPVKARDKAPATPHGFKDAVTDAFAVRAWFSSQPDLNLGLRTGTQAGMFALDVDPKHDGDKTLAALEVEFGPLPKTVRSRTGSGGEHIFFRLPERKVRNSVAFLPGLDTRAEGGYVVAPPSVHANGNAYAWQPGCSPDEIELAAAPDWLIERIAAPEKPKREAKAPKQSKPTGGAQARLLKRATRYVEKTPAANEGGRNAAAFQLAGHVRAIEEQGQHLDDDVIVEVMREWNGRCQPPLEDLELADCVANSAKNGNPPPPKPSRTHDSPEITPLGIDGRQRLLLVPSELHLSADKAIRIFADERPHALFQWCRELVCVVSSVEGQGPTNKRKSARIHRLTEAGLCDRLNRRIQFQHEARDPETKEPVYVSVDCPLGVSRWGLSRGAWPEVAALTGVIEAPTMLPDGRLLITSGYDADSGLYGDFDPSIYPKIPHAPDRDYAERALKFIASYFDEFPFESDAHRAVHYSAMLSTVARAAFPHVPAHGYSAPVMASGKSLLAESVVAIATGGESAPISQPNNAEEFEKRIHSALLEGRRVGVIDNVTLPLSDNTLCTAITSSMVGIRRFKTQELVQVPTWNCTWLATGNNLTFDKDMRSRAVMCRLDPRIENPAGRTFRIPNLLQRVRNDRAKLVMALLCLLRAYHAAGRPDVGIKPLNRFEGWSAIVRAPLVWYGIGDPVETMDAISRSDEETQLLSGLLHALRAVYGDREFTAKEAVASVDPALHDILKLICRARDGDGLDARRLGKFFQRCQQRVVEGLRLELARSVQGTNHYRVVLLPEPSIRGSGGSGGSVPSARGSSEDDSSSHAHAHTRTHAHARDLDRTLPRLPPLPREVGDDDVAEQPAVLNGLLADAAAHEAATGDGEINDGEAAPPGHFFDPSALPEDPG